MKLREMAAIGTNVYLHRKYPVSLVHFVTNRCNARCPHCFIDFDDEVSQRSQMSMEEIDRLAQHLGPSLVNVNLTGGEPFLRRDMVDIARCYFSHTAIESIFVTTNGTFPNRILNFTRTLLSDFPERKLIFSLSIDDFPQEHNATRRVKNLYENALASYRGVHALGEKNAMANIAITVSQTNHASALELYDHLVDREGVRTVTATIVRDEGVYRIPQDKKAAILDTYARLTDRIIRDLERGKLEGYNTDTFQGRLMNQKNKIMYRVIRQTYLNPHFVSYCYAGSLFGIIGADGTVYPCEVLDRPLGNLRDYDFDFLKLWNDRVTREARSWIKDTKCHCTYECAWSFNILSNARYQPELIAAGIALPEQEAVPGG
jgi:MoaA/NifB/PqqE/SkfB family radical SAM enzyme